MIGAVGVLGLAAGWVRLAVWVVAAGAAARAVRRWAFPDLGRALAALVEVVVGLTFSILVMEACGTIGLFSRWFVLGAMVVASVAVVGLVRRRAPLGHDATSQTDHAGPRRLETADRIALALTAVIAVSFVVATVVVGWRGVLDNDSLRYHGPFVARWVQLHDLTHLHHTSREVQEVFFPANNELVTAGGVLAFGTDWFMPYLNIGWFALALLAAWCVPLDPRRRPIAVMAAAAVVAAPRLMSTQPGSGRNDLAAAALLLAFVAIAHRLGGRTPGLLVAGAALGLAVGTKLSVAVPAAALVLAVALLHRGRRIATMLTLGAGAIVAGGYWYARNWARAGNPLPWYRVHLGPIHLDGPRFLGVEEHGQRIVDRMSSGSFWSTTVPEGLRYAIGPWWAPVLLLTAGVVVVGLSTRGWPRALAAIVLVAVAAHAITPFSAGGDHGPTMFGPQLRFLAAPALLAGVLVALLVPLRFRWLVGAAVAYVASSVVSFAGVAAAIGFVAVVLGVGAFLRQGVSATGPARLAMAAVVVAAGVAAPLLATRNRYEDPRRSAAWAVFHLFRDVHDSRVAVGVFRHTYPLAGKDLSNHVQLIGVDEPHGGFRPADTEDEWVRAIRAGHYDYVVVGRVTSVGGPPFKESTWTRSIPGAVEVYLNGSTEVFHL